MKVLHRYRATGVHPMLLAFLDWWEREGICTILVLPDGGLRTDNAKQRSLFAKGVTRAETLADTPHGRGGALDLAPLVNGHIPWDTLEAFKPIGTAAEAHGLEWGGRWRFLDACHVELAHWRELPYPPKPWGPSL